VRGYPSATWKFHPLVAELCRTVRELGTERINTVSHQYGGFLPDWHPWEPYTDFYAGRKRTSAAREMVPFELEILLAAFGSVTEVRAIKTQARKWDAAFDDTYLMLLRFASGLVGNLTIELHQVAPVRTTRVSAADTGIILDMSAQELRTYDKASDSWRFMKPRALRQNWGFQFEHVYREEIHHFLLALDGGDYPKTWAEDRHLSDVLYAAELSHSSGRAIGIGEVAAAYDGLSWIDDE
jgi:predicted dehydrogenase